MPRATINGKAVTVPPGVTILDALQRQGIDLPALCHDPRIADVGICRLCSVEVEGQDRPVPACHTTLQDGDRIRTDSAALQGFRQTNLEWLAAHVDPASMDAFPDKPLHRALREHAIAPALTSRGDDSPAVDDSHPYIRVDMAQCISCMRCVRICDEVQGQSVWHAVARGDRLHMVPDRGETLLESSCVSCGACVDACPTAALTDKTRRVRGQPDRWTRTTCGYCGVGCELEVGTRDGRIAEVRPAMDAKVNRGHLCVKGRYAFDFGSADDRITRPLIRQAGSWEQTDWPTALSHCASEFQRIAAAYGPDAIGVLGSARATNEENYLAQKFARVVLGTNNVDSCARVCHTPTAVAMKLMLGTGAATNSFDDIEHASTIMLVGCNPTENHPIVGARIRAAVKRGSRLILIDPRRTELASCAAIHLALRPGTNVPLLNAIAHVLVTEGLIDRAYVATRVRGFDEFASFVAAWTPDHAAAICGVSASSIRDAARLYAGSKASICFHGLGMTEHTQGTEGVMCLVNLALLTGHMGRPGTGINPLRGQNNVQGAAQMGCDPAALTGSAPLAANRDRVGTRWGTAIPGRPGLNLLQMMDAAAAGKLKALWTIGYDVYLTLANEPATRAALSRLECIVVQDFVLNETARQFGQVFLPAATLFEKDGTFMNSDRRIQRVRSAMPAPDQALPDWQIICRMAKAMGKPHGFTFDSPESIWNEIRTVWPAVAGIAWSRIADHGLQWPCPDEQHPGSAILHAERFSDSVTAPLQCIDYVPTPERSDAEYPLLLTTGRVLYHFNSGTMTRRTPNLQLLATDELEISPQDAAAAGLQTGDRTKLISRHGETELRCRVSARVQPGQLFASFHDPGAFTNAVTSPYRDRKALAPEYKVTAVRVERAGG